MIQFADHIWKCFHACPSTIHSTEEGKSIVKLNLKLVKLLINVDFIKLLTNI